MTSLKVALVGHCGPDSYMLRSAVKHVLPDAQIAMIDDGAALKMAIADGVTVLLVNRVLGYGFDADSGVGLIGALRASHPQLKLLLISNYADAQAQAVAAGAMPGFGKNNIGSPKMREALAAVK